MPESQAIKMLEQKIEVLEEENLQLSERAEDALLLGLIAAAIQGQKKYADIFDLVLERISILKNIPYCTCGFFNDEGLQPIATYAAFSNRPNDGYPIIFMDEIRDELCQGSVFVSQIEGIKLQFNKADFEPSAIALIPFASQPYSEGLFLFAELGANLQTMTAKAPLLQQAVDMAIGRVDNQFLQQALFEANEVLEDRIAERTRDLSVANRELQAQIAESEKYQEQLAQARKMEAIGTLAGGIAHDFNNLMTGVQGQVSLMLAQRTPADADQERLLSIESYVNSATHLTSQLLGLARKGKYDVLPVDPNHMVQKSLDLFGRTRKEVAIHLDLATEIWPIEVDQTQIEQVLLNICINAWQAMPSGGDIWVRTQNSYLDNSDAKACHVTPGRYVVISFKDSGVGIKPSVQEKIFNPFFTTKEKMRGTGLGLASAYGIITNHHGMINVHSELGHGATFTIYLPASSKMPRQEEESPASVTMGSGTVLLVDDEEMIRFVGRALLEEMGYDVMVAENGKEAIDLYQQNQDKIDVVLLDVIMPGMSGGHTYEHLKKIDPHIKVLVSSGYSVDGEASKLLDRGCNGFIQKPFNLIDLSQKIDSVLKG